MVEALCFRVVCASVRPCVRECVHACVRISRLRDISRTSNRIIFILGHMKGIYLKMNWLDFGNVPIQDGRLMDVFVLKIRLSCLHYISRTRNQINLIVGYMNGIYLQMSTLTYFWVPWPRKLYFGLLFQNGWARCEMFRNNVFSALSYLVNEL